MNFGARCGVVLGPPIHTEQELKTEMRDAVKIKCPKHGEVFFEGVRDLGSVVTRYCPLCEHEARHPQEHADAPYPLQGTSPSVIPELNRGD